MMHDQSAAVITFPVARTRPPTASHLLDPYLWNRTHAAASFADLFRAASIDEAVAGMREMTFSALAHLLEDNTIAIATLRAVIASLIESDRRMATAADALLRQRGL